MITRIWHGRTRQEDEDRYLNFLLNEGTREYLETDGNISVKVWREKHKNCSHFYTVSEWEDINAIKSFAGNEIGKAKYYNDDKDLLIEFEENVRHYESYDVSKTKINNYLKQFDQTFNGGSWQGESFVEKLSDVNEKAAFKNPMPGVHCIAEIIWHCLYWRTVMIKNLEGQHEYRDQTADEMNFLPVETLKQKGWMNLRIEFQETQNRILEVLRSKNDEFLNREYCQGSTYDYLVEGIMQHDIYHLGQVGLVKKMIMLTLEE